MRPPSSRPRAPAALIAALAVAATLVSGCSGSTPSTASAPATSIAQLHPTTMNLVRVPFCDLVPRTAVRAALGRPSTTHQQWSNGDRPPLDHAAADISHEFGCAWTASPGAAARAWVFARPVTAAFGRQVISSSARTRGCRTVSSVAFGRPGLEQTCSQALGRIRVRHAGLFGASWLTCEVTGHGPATRARADAWCAQVAGALDTSG